MKLRCVSNAVLASGGDRVVSGVGLFVLGGFADRVGLADHKCWHTRIELANAIFEYLAIWHNGQRRHASLGMLTPIEFEARHQHQPAA